VNSAIIREDCKKLLNNFDGLRDLHNKTVLITGSNGLIGNYFVNLLSIANEFNNANIKAYCISKHDPVWKDSNFKYISRDLAQRFSFRHNVDYIFHCACYGRPQKFLQNELETIALNVDATKTLLNIARENNAKFLFLSTSEIYGNPSPEQIPTSETYPGNSLTSSGRAAYVESKRLGESLCYIYQRNYGVDVKIARIALVYGPGLTINDERVMGNFMKKAIINKHITLIDEGKGLRTYCYIADALNMMLKMILQGKEVLYNVGGVETVSIFEMAEMIACHCGATCKASSGKGMKDAPDMVKLDVSKICSEFGIVKFTPFQEGLLRTIDWNLLREKK
jgi:dTDP-glucose 4,6-dehydratase/UDP-glucuronate decarboxylase